MAKKELFSDVDELVSSLNKAWRRLDNKLWR